MLAFNRQRTSDHRLDTDTFSPIDLKAFHQCVETCEASVWHLCMRMLGDRAAAERATETTFWAAHANRTDPRFCQDTRTWVLSYASRLCLDHLRHECAATLALPRPRLGQDSPRMTGVADPRRAHLLLSYVDRLAPIDRLIVVLRSWEHLSFEQLAEVIGEPVAVIRCRYHRARERLADLLASGASEPIPAAGRA